MTIAAAVPLDEEGSPFYDGGSDVHGAREAGVNPARTRHCER
jgi:hypothetical protein